MSCNVYPVTQTELHYDGYTVKIGGKKVDVNTARVSFRFAGYSEEAKNSDITVKDFYYNGKKVCDGDYSLSYNKYCENIVIE